MTFGDYLALSRVLFGVESKATKWIEEKIRLEGEDEEVIADESQMLLLLTNLSEKDEK